MNTTEYTSILVTNVIPSGAAFALRHDTKESCFIPANLVSMSAIQPGDTVSALLIDNPNDSVRMRTPYMVCHVKDNYPVATPEPAVQLELALGVEATPMVSRADMAVYVRKCMREGGVWTVSGLYQRYMNNPDAAREDNLAAYNGISAALRKMFDNDECAKWSMWSKASQSKPGREWFSCYPSRVDVDEWVDV